MTMDWVLALQRSIYDDRSRALAYTMMGTTRMLLHVLQGNEIHEKDKDEKVIQTWQSKPASQTQKGNDIFHHNTHDGSIPL